VATFRRVLHLLTLVAVVAALAVATSSGMLGAGAATHQRRESSNPNGAVESYAPANVPDAFTIQTLPIPTPTTTTVLAAPAVPRATPTTTAPSTRVDPVAQPYEPQLVARVTSRTLLVYANPNDTNALLALAATTEFDNPRVLPVVQRGGDWLLVQLPTRPNGSVGWIRARDVTLSSVDDRVDVDLAGRQLVWTHDGIVKLQSTVAIGAPSSPTPTGSFFVTDVLPQGPGSDYGAWVIALDAHSDAFTEFEGGDARIAIHGTNEPSSIGRASSSGCVRVPANVLAMLAGALPAGTPVVIS
jgi:lipoprotein-anchoring transpeptidase ErfK/SrfK